MAEKIKKLTFNRLIDYLETDTKIQLFCDGVKVCEPFNVYISPDIYSLYDFHACEVESVKTDGINQMSIYIKGNTDVPSSFPVFVFSCSYGVTIHYRVPKEAWRIYF